MAQIAEKTGRIDVLTKTAKSFAEKGDAARRLQTMPGVGPLTALTVEAFAPDMATFRRGRDFSAWPGLFPRSTHQAKRNGSVGCRKPTRLAFNAF
ncbi:hypothetical protein P775_22575 [Puniceibacterium antarcticum]|uniref:Transposase IS116/IS110/IS902 C-terminal domain-containing protein n=1 Tax=Puniceibacterium antarcticum TaxID=1206336 RepID=A0A2G8R8L3_9RHOB|nr:transposase [Puniceibacterium antarcticum]PIL17896.1 hypothetical protein P775_22575 [Puniceibacterium antarcticum]